MNPIVRVVGSDCADGYVVLRLESDSGKTFVVPFTPDAAVQIIMALRQAATDLPNSPQEKIRDAAMYSVVGCQPILTPDGRSGLAVVTQEGFEIPIVIDPPASAVLRNGIDQIDAGRQSARLDH